MGTELQIAIPLLVTFVILCAIAVKRKYFKLETFVIILTVFTIGIVSTLQYVSVKNEQTKYDQFQSDSAGVSIMIAEKYMLDGDYISANDILSELSKNLSENELVKLSQARCSLLSGNYSVAVQLYQQLSSEYQDESDSAMKLYNCQLLTNNAIITNLKANGKNPDDYNLSETEISRVDEDEIIEKILKNIKNDYKNAEDVYGEDTVKAVEYAITLMEEFKNTVSDGYCDDDRLSQALSKLEKLMDENEYLDSNLHLRLARMKGYTAKGDYDKIAEAADEHITSEELTVLTELYIKELIDENDFTQEYLSISEEKAEELIDHCKKILEENKSSMTEEHYNRYYDSIKRLEKQIDNPAAFAIRCDLIDKIENGSADMKSKNYLALAKLENYSGNEDLAHQYIEEALGTASESTDSNYSVPMSQISEIMQGNSTSQEIKNVATYVNEAVDHSLPSGLKPDYLYDYSNDGYYDDAEDNNSESSKSFEEEMGSYIKESTAKLNIGVIDADNFPQVKARVQIQSDTWKTTEELKQHLMVYDCGSRITDFTLEKMTFSSSHIILLCDVSGSMSNNIQDLKDAVISFAQNMIEGELVSVIGFNDGIEFVETFSGNPSVVESYAQNLYSSGGTAIYDSILYATERFTYDINSNNIIIAFTDGQDGSPANENEIYNYLGAAVADKSITVYTLGLGSVDTEYLKMLAEGGNGSFLYADNFEEINEFYDFIHGQLNNQYILTYNAKNQSLNKRELMISVDGESGSAKKTYYLDPPEHTEEGQDSYNPYTVTDAELTVYGLSTKFLYKSTKNQTVKLKGEGFDSGDDISIIIEDAVRYQLSATYIDENTYEILIPAEISPGSYDMTVAIRGESVKLSDELVIAVNATQKNFRFGSYNFTALTSYEDNSGNTVLSGNVVMNGWLIFKGDVVITSEYENVSKVWLKDTSGAYINYSNSSSTGLAKTLGDNGIVLNIYPLGEFCLYCEPYEATDYKDFPVDEITKAQQYNLGFMFIENSNLKIYPDMLSISGGSFNFNLPFQQQLLRNFSFGKLKTLETDYEMLLTATEIAMTGKVKYDDSDSINGDSKGIEFILVSFPLRISGIEVEVDTLRNDYKIGASVTFKSLADMDSIDFKFTILDGKCDGFELKTGGDFSKDLIKAPVPTSFSDFGLGISGFSTDVSDKTTLEKILAKQITAIFNVNIGSIDSVIPKLSKIVETDAKGVFVLDECKLSLCVRDLRIAFEANLSLFDKYEIGKCAVKLGSFKYTNALIGYYNETQYGFSAEVMLGKKWEFTNLDVEASGRTEVTVGYPYTGLWIDGDADFDLRWWIVSADIDVSGDILFGAYKNSSGNLQFSFIVRGENTKGEYSGFHLYVTKASGIGVYTY